MILKLLQLNIFQGKFLDRVIEFVRQNDFDLLHFQEVTSGRMSKGGVNYYPDETPVRPLSPNEKYVGIDCFRELKKELGLTGELVVTNSYINDRESNIGNATFFSKKLKLIGKNIVWLKDYIEIPQNFTDYANMAHAALVLKFEMEGRIFRSINTHLAWGIDSSDTEHKIKEAEILHEKIRDIDPPFVFSGDFNVTPDTKTASMFEDLGQNLIRTKNILNTLNPNIHMIKHLFPPGLAVDQVFISKDIKVKSFKVLENIDLSDHLGIAAELEL